MSYKEGDWYIYCDICGQRSLASNSSKLSTYTGRGGLIACRHDVDKIDYGTVPYRTPAEKNIPWTRINHTSVDNSSPLVDLENMRYQWYLAASQDNAILMASQNDAWLIAEQPI